MVWYANQVVWMKAGRAAGSEWFPGIIVDASRHLSLIDAIKMGSHHVLRLGDGKICTVQDEYILDFCIHFEELYPLMNQDLRYRKAAEIAVKLAAARASDEIPKDMGWEEWGRKNLHRFFELSVSESFYDALTKQVARKRQSDAAEDNLAKATVSGGAGGDVKEKPCTSRHPSPPISVSEHSLSTVTNPAAENDSLESNSQESTVAGFQNGHLVWVRVSVREGGTNWWPALVLKSSDVGMVQVAVLAKPPYKLNTTHKLMKDFCYDYDTLFDHVSTDTDYLDAVLTAVQMVKNLSDEVNEFLSPEAAFTWALRHMDRYTACLVSDDDLKAVVDKIPTAAASTALLPEIPKKRKRKMEETKPKKEHKTKKAHKEKPIKEPKPMGRPKKHPEEKAKKPKEKVKKEKPFSTPPAAESTPKPKTPRSKKRSIETEFSAEELALLTYPLDQGWLREYVRRSLPCTKAADVYYKPPDGSRKRRSMPDIVKYLSETGCTELDARHFSFAMLLTNHANETISDASFARAGRPSAGNKSVNSSLDATADLTEPITQPDAESNESTLV